MMFQILNLMNLKFRDLTKYSNLLLNNLEMLKRIVLLPQVNPPWCTLKSVQELSRPRRCSRRMRGPENPTTGAAWTYLPWRLVFLAMLQTTGGENLVQQSEFPFWKIISRILYQSLLLNILTTRNQFCYKFLYFSCKLGIHTRYAFMLALQWRIKTGRQGRTPPLLCPNYFIFTQFSAKICKIIGWRTPSQEMAPPGNSWIRHCGLISFICVKVEGKIDLITGWCSLWGWYPPSSWEILDPSLAFTL